MLCYRKAGCGQAAGLAYGGCSDAFEECGLETDREAASKVVARAPSRRAFPALTCSGLLYQGAGTTNVASGKITASQTLNERDQ